jgi:NAD-dependent DNA ligase
MIERAQKGFVGLFTVIGFIFKMRNFNKDCRRFEDLFSTISKSQSESHSRIITLCTEALNAEAAHAFGSMSITELKKYGASVQPLINAGYTTVYDINNSSAESLKTLYGIGPLKAQAIINAFQRLKAEVYGKKFLTLNPYQLTEEEVSLLNEVARYEKLRAGAPVLINEIFKRRKDFEHPLLWIKNESRFLKVVLSSDKQKHVLDYAHNVGVHVNELYNYANKNYHQIIHLPVTGPNNPQTRFKANSDWFFAILNKISHVNRPK